MAFLKNTFNSSAYTSQLSKHEREILREAMIRWSIAVVENDQIHRYIEPNEIDETTKHK